jgi:small subunit ribosomal protein S21
MAHVSLNEGESIESLLRRFRNSVARSGLLREVKDRRFFRSKAEKARVAAQRAARRHRRRNPTTP